MCGNRNEGLHTREAQTCQDSFFRCLISWRSMRQDSVVAGVFHGLARRYLVHPWCPRVLPVPILEQCANVLTPYLSNGLYLYSQFMSLMMMGPLDQWCVCVCVCVWCLFSSQPCSCVFSGVWTRRHVGFSNPAAPRTCGASRCFGRQKAFQEFRPRPERSDALDTSLCVARRCVRVGTPFPSERAGMTDWPATWGGGSQA